MIFKKSKSAYLIKNVNELNYFKVDGRDFKPVELVNTNAHEGGITYTSYEFGTIIATDCIDKYRSAMDHQYLINPPTLNDFCRLTETSHIKLKKQDKAFILTINTGRKKQEKYLLIGRKPKVSQIETGEQKLTYNFNVEGYTFDISFIPHENNHGNWCYNQENIVHQDVFSRTEVLNYIVIDEDKRDKICEKNYSDALANARL